MGGRGSGSRMTSSGAGVGNTGGTSTVSASVGIPTGRNSLNQQTLDDYLRNTTTSRIPIEDVNRFNSITKAGDTIRVTDGSYGYIYTKSTSAMGRGNFTWIEGRMLDGRPIGGNNEVNSNYLLSFLKSTLGRGGKFTLRKEERGRR